MAGRKWLGVCIVTGKAFLFWRVLRLKNFTAAIICESLVDVVRELGDKHFFVCAIVTDNAANEISAVGELARTTKLPLVRIPCFSHTVNLAVQDFLTGAFGG
jgi:hypothetical protein